jgi:hypothetical protein
MNREHRLEGARGEERHLSIDHKSLEGSTMGTADELPTEQSMFRLRIKPDRRRSTIPIDPATERRRQPR